MITITIAQHDVLQLMKRGLGRTRIAKALKMSELGVYHRQEALARKGIVTKGTIRGVHRRVLKDGRSYRVDRTDRMVAIRENSARRAAAWREAMNAHPEPGPARVEAARAAVAVVDREIRRERAARRAA